MDNYEKKYLKYKKKYLDLKFSTKGLASMEQAAACGTSRTVTPAMPVPPEIESLILGMTSCSDVMKYHSLSVHTRNLVKQNIIHIGLKLNIFEKDEFIRQDKDDGPDRKFIKKSTRGEYTIDELYQEFVRRCYIQKVDSLELNRDDREAVIDKIKRGEIDMPALEKGIKLREQGISDTFIYDILELNVENPDLDIVEKAIQLSRQGIVRSSMFNILVLMINNPDLDIVEKAIQLSRQGIVRLSMFDILRVMINNPDPELRIIEKAIQLSERGFNTYNIVNILKIIVKSSDHNIFERVIQLREQGIDNYFILDILRVMVENPELDIFERAIQLREQGMDPSDIIQHIR